MNSLPKTDDELATRLRNMHAALNRIGVFMSPQGNDPSASGQRMFAAHQKSGTLNDPAAVLRAMHDIPRVFQRANTAWSRGTTHTAKRVVERWRCAHGIAPVYVSDGDFTAALVLLGFKVTWRRGRKPARFCAVVRDDSCATEPVKPAS